MDSLGVRHFHSVFMTPNTTTHNATLMAPTAIKPSSSATKPRIPIECLKAKRRQVEQRLEALLALQQQADNGGGTTAITHGNANTNTNTNGTMSHQHYSSNRHNTNMTNSHNNWSSSSFPEMDHYNHSTNDSSCNQPRVDSSDWLATLASLLPSNSNSNSTTNSTSNSNCHTNTSCYSSHTNNNVRDQPTSNFSFANYSFNTNTNTANKISNHRSSSSSSSFGISPSHHTSNTSNALDTLNNTTVQNMPTLPSPSSLRFVNVNYSTKGAAANTNTAITTTTTNNQGVRRVSQNHSLQDAFVLSDRLAEIMPDLDVSNLVTNTNTTNNDVSDMEDMNNLFVDTIASDLGWTNTDTDATTAFANPMTATSSDVGGNGSSSSIDCVQSQQPQQDLSAMPVRMIASTSRVSSTSSFTSSCASSNAVMPTLRSNSNKNKKTTKPRASNTTTSDNTRKLGRPSTFPQKLFKMLKEIQQPENAHLCDIVNFVNDGSAFQIYNNDAFVTEILPRFFKMTSFSSFQRQLQLYNLKRVTKGGAYHHAKFHRDHPERLSQMVRKQSRPSTFVLSIGR